MSATSLQSLNTMWLKEAVTEPPCTRTLSGPQLLALREEPLEVRVPACSVAVERGVIASQAVSCYCFCFNVCPCNLLLMFKSKSKEYYPLLPLLIASQAVSCYCFCFNEFLLIHY
jgi:hypothetical protein